MAVSAMPRRLPIHIVNGIAVTLGILLVQASFTAVLGPVAAQVASAGAVYASLPHLADRAARAGRRVFMGGLSGCAVTALVMSLRAHTLALGAVIGAVTFTAMMAMAWGKKAAPIAFSAVLAVVFAMALPGGRPLPAIFAWGVLGVVVYTAWTVLSTKLLERRYRALSVSAALAATARLLRARASVLAESATPWGWIREEAAVAERIEAARALVFTAPRRCEARRETAILLATMELRDVLLASALDLDRLGADAAARGLRARLGEALRTIAGALDAAGDAVRDGRPVAASKAEPLARAPELLRRVSFAPDDPRAALIAVVEGRLKHLADDVAHVHALTRREPGDEDIPFSSSALARFAADDRWPLSAIAGSLSLASPVSRHALRTGLAVAAAYYLAIALPWAAHPHWLVLSVAVVLRGTLEQTLSRRNARVLGTALGCAFVLVVATWLPGAASRLSFPVAAGVAHAFVNVKYLLTAAAGTVMALLQARLAAPTAPFAAAERLADTAVGALLAWAFSYVLPSWERRTLPAAIARAEGAVAGYARAALVTSGDDEVEPRIARQRAYDALEAVASAFQRSAVEPRRVRPPAREVLAFLDVAQRVMAHLSSVRLLLVRRRDALDVAETAAALASARAEVDALFGPGPGDVHEPAPQLAEPLEPPASRPLPWLLRRLSETVRDAGALARHASAARAALGG